MLCIAVELDDDSCEHCDDCEELCVTCEVGKVLNSDYECEGGYSGTCLLRPPLLPSNSGLK